MKGKISVKMSWMGWRNGHKVNSSACDAVRPSEADSVGRIPMNFLRPKSCAAHGRCLDLHVNWLYIIYFWSVGGANQATLIPH
jgi:hypothetical protein